MHEPMLRAAATYFMTGRNARGSPLDSVARFHLGNGARLERLDWPADLSERGRDQSYGLMVNYLYDLGDIEKNHEAYAENRTVTAASADPQAGAPVARARDGVELSTTVILWRDPAWITPAHRPALRLRASPGCRARPGTGSSAPPLRSWATPRGRRRASRRGSPGCRGSTAPPR